jgi:16S rRNA (cytosine1402-N4)-methyltransferase
MTKEEMHKPVLLNEVLAALDPQPGNFIIDGTADGGGHAAAILEKITPGGKLLALDWDEAMVAGLKERFGVEKENPSGSRKNANHLPLVGEENRIVLVQGNYADLPEILREKKLDKADGLLLDLGFSSEQLESSGRGFSFSERAKDEPLFMTYSDDQEPVRALLKRIGEKELADILYEFGGERMSRRIAKAIIERRRRKPIEIAGDLADVVRAALPKHYERGRIDPATRTFQALRIYANDELGNLTRVLATLSEIVVPGGRTAVITFHSLEDRIVKNAFRDLAKAKTAELINKKPISASREEIRANPRARSAKLRAIKLADSD